MAKKSYNKPTLKVESNKTITDYKYRALQQKRKERAISSEENSSLINLLVIPVVIILYAVLYNILIGGSNTYSFQGLIQYLQKSPSFDFAWLRSSNTLQFVSEWTILDGIRQFFNFILNSFKSMIILSGGVLQAISGFIFILGYFIGI